MRYFLSLLSALLLFPVPVHSVETLTSKELYEGIQSGRFDVIVDVRTLEEWKSGHLPNATFLNSLNSYGTAGQIATPSDLDGCQGVCTIVVYCRSGARAAAAAKIFEDNGFKAPIYNGLGVGQWTAAGYTLVNTASSVPKCVEFNSDACNPPITLPPMPKPFKICFSGETIVQVKHNGATLMKDLKIGDKVLAANGKYEEVYSFGHRDDYGQAEFIQISPSGLEISKDHMLMVGGKFIPASLLRVGDELESANGEVVTVGAIKTVLRNGAYAPFTASGTIVVNLIKASNYIAFQESDRLVVGGWESPFTYHWIAHLSQSPHRIWSRLGLRGVEEYTEDGVSTWVSGPHRWSEWVLAQNSMVTAAVLVPAIGLGMLSMVVEGVVSLFA